MIIKYCETLIRVEAVTRISLQENKLIFFFVNDDSRSYMYEGTNGKAEAAMAFETISKAFIKDKVCVDISPDIMKLMLVI